MRKVQAMLRISHGALLAMLLAMALSPATAGEGRADAPGQAVDVALEQGQDAGEKETETQAAAGTDADSDSPGGLASLSLRAQAGTTAAALAVGGTSAPRAEADPAAAMAAAKGEHPVYHLRPEPWSDADAVPATLQELMELAVASNLGLLGQEYTVEKNHYSVDRTYYAFDPSLGASLGYNQNNRGSTAAQTQGSVTGSESYSGDFSVTVPREYGDSFRLSYDLSRSSYQTTGGGEDFSIPTTYNAGVNLSYNRPLMRGAGRLVNLIPRYQASNNLQLSYDRLDDDIRRLKKNVMDAYFNAVAAREAIVVREASLELALQQLERAVERYKVGLAIQAEVNQAENSVLSQRTQLLSARQNYADLLDSLTLLIGLPQQFGITVDTGGALITLSDNLPDGLWDMVLENSYELKSLNIQLANLRLGRQQQLNGLKPDLGLSMSYGRSGEDDTLGAAVTGYENESYGISLNWSATPGERDREAQLAQTELDLASLELSIQDTELQLLGQLRGYQRTLQTRYEQIGLAEDNLEVVKETYEITVARREVGLATTLDVVDAQEDVLNAELALLNAKVSYQQSYREILLLAGLV